MKQCYCFIVLLFANLAAFSQTFTQEEVWRSLTIHNQEIGENLVLAEQILDLVDASTSDSVFRKKTQRHRFPLSFMLEHGWKLYWKSVNQKREKFIGTNARYPSNWDGKLREWDINFFLMPHLDKYVNFQLMAYKE